MMEDRKRKVFIFSYLPRHLKKILPLIKELQFQNNIDLYVVLMTVEEEEIAVANNIAYCMLEQYTTLKARYIFDMGWGFQPLINALKQIDPDLFIAVEVNYILRNATRFCKENGIYSLIIQHGTPNEYSMHAFAPFEGDAFAAWGDYSKDLLMNYGVEMDKIIVTGGIPFDRTLALSSEKESISRILNIDANKKWIVFTTQGVGAYGRPTEAEIQKSIETVAEIAVNFVNVEIIFQVHPGQTIESVSQFALEKNNKAVVVKYCDTESLLASSDGVITFFSTTALDSVILGKPLLLINLEDKHEFLPFGRMEAAYNAYTTEDIEFFFNKMLDDKNEQVLKQRIAAEYINYLNDGKALSRVVALVNQMLYDKEK